MAKEIENNKLYFTEITENEKRVINLIRTYVTPLGSVEEYLDFLVDNILHKLVEKTIKLHAFTEVMQHERKNKEVSNIEMLARVNQFEDYIRADGSCVNKYVKSILADIVSNLDGDIKPLETYTMQEQLQEEEKTLDKIQES